MAKRIEAKSNWTQLITTALDHAGGYGRAIDALRSEATNSKWDSERIRAELLAPVAAYYGATIIEATRGTRAGQQTVDRKAEGGEAANKAWQRLHADIVGKQSEKVEIEVPAELIAAARKLAKLASEYEGARSLASKALALAWVE